MAQGLRRKMCGRESYNIQNSAVVHFKHVYPINPFMAHIIEILSGWVYSIHVFPSFCSQPYPTLKLNNHIIGPEVFNLGMAACSTQLCFVYWSVDRQVQVQVNASLNGRNHRQVIHHKAFPYGEGSLGPPDPCSCWTAGFFAVDTLSAWRRSISAPTPTMTAKN
ncbi:uncharacterized protein LY79DRAFT_11121 [Colletotrichum navitas]|uniref:Uncharacterized protein n=1 Tax=Colletotrichum navitas TaxID=681940 RepID=A0AAD8VAB3_9PEZI|nr:uncharacterized protein LY79DRAFT_11121 [Colletotrichum navitas]KAK1600212.1 hypothetical protein LY79DRAFT_11121 [Colletotrichum navitas]